MTHKGWRVVKPQYNQPHSRFLKKAATESASYEMQTSFLERSVQVAEWLVRLANQSWKDCRLSSPAVVIDNQLVIAEDLIIVLPIWTSPFHILYFIVQAWANSVDSDEAPQMWHLHQGLQNLPLTQFTTHVRILDKVW